MDDFSGLTDRAAADSGLAAYHWDIAQDVISWSPWAAKVLGCDPGTVATGRQFAALLDPDNLTSRHDTVMHGGGQDPGGGVPFRIEYRFMPLGRTGRASQWLEDQGRWHAGLDGRPAHVFGTLRRIDERHRQDQQPSHLGHCDALTGLMNRGRMMEWLGGAMAAAEREGSACSFLVIAITNLAAVNEAYGFEVADEVIHAVGRRLARVARAGDAVARYSGSKFGIVLNNCSREDLAFAAERLLGTARESMVETACGPIWALLSIGAVVTPQHATGPTMAIARAEEALTQARKQPAGDVVIYEPSEQRRSERSDNARHAAEIIRCLKENRFQLAFQPVVDGQTGEAAFHEALLRMTGEDGSIVPAGHLIPAAETLGLVRLIDKAVTEMAVDVLARRPAAAISLNISGATATDPRWYPEIVSVIAGNLEVANRLIVEITETVALGDLSHVIRFVEELRFLGCRVAIDDFGAGFTSFRSLRALPVEYLKLDGTFCRELSLNDENQYYVRALIDLARTFGIKTVAEWVETESDALLLRNWGVDLMQGRLFGMAELSPPWPEVAPDARLTIAGFEKNLEGELAKLRRAITLLDRAFPGREEPLRPAEPSFADLVSDTAARRRAR
ncbi:GGDEF and EAL domain-containing protein [Aestuariivirga sp.]|uniref:GGDEF and EAL domain-containing protein n=1 Tax=Aestuariivirga sp. TaxID=2650926 RepID=UPI0025C67EB6|nr:GGDEF and EAL domain-containing protein [Aestuariivirga sp.]MCA3555922.1 GGDEF and EAL domain-containing protein [Aestuariivirga sp.]